MIKQKVDKYARLGVATINVVFVKFLRSIECNDVYSPHLSALTCNYTQFVGFETITASPLFSFDFF